MSTTLTFQDHVRTALRRMGATLAELGERLEPPRTHSAVSRMLNPGQELQPHIKWGIVDGLNRLRAARNEEDDGRWPGRFTLDSLEQGPEPVEEGGEAALPIDAERLADAIEERLLERLVERLAAGDLGPLAAALEALPGEAILRGEPADLIEVPRVPASCGDFDPTRPLSEGVRLELVPREEFGPGATPEDSFSVDVEGESMAGYGITSGDVLRCRWVANWDDVKPGKPHVFRWQGALAVRIYKVDPDGSRWLVSVPEPGRNDHYPVSDDDDVAVVGRVVAAWRSFN